MSRPPIAITATLEGYPEAEDEAGAGPRAPLGPWLSPAPDAPWGLKHVALASYVKAVWEAGGLPFVLPCVGEMELVEGLLAQARGLLITGGADVAPEGYGAGRSPKLGKVNPYRDALDRTVVAYAEAHPNLPVLGICRGIQAYNVYAGGTLVQDIPSEVGEQVAHKQTAPPTEPSHLVDLADADCRLAAIAGAMSLWVNSFHHQAVRDVASGLRAVAWAPDGVIEALEKPSARWCVLVQWHPEHMTATREHARDLFEAFVAACRA